MNENNQNENYNENLQQPEMQQMPNNMGNMGQPQMQQMPNNMDNMSQPQMQQMPNNMDNMGQPQMQQMPNNMGNMNQPNMQQMPNSMGNMGQPQMQQMPNSMGNMGQPQMQQMPNGFGNMNQQASNNLGGKNNKIPLIIGAAVAVLVIIIIIAVSGGKKTLTCTKTDSGSNVTFKLTFKKDDFKGGNVNVNYDLSNATQAEIDSLKSADLCSALKASATYNVGKCSSKLTGKTLKVNAEIEGVSSGTSFDEVKSNFANGGYTCK